MRKIKLAITHDDNTFQPIRNCYVKDGDNTETYSAPVPLEHFLKAELLTIFYCNQLLVDNNQPKMTAEEEEFLIHPMGQAKTPTPEELQELSGFKVEKKITYK